MENLERETYAKRGRKAAGDSLASCLAGFKSASGYRQGVSHFRTGVGNKQTKQSATAKFDYINREGKYEDKREDLGYTESGNMPEWAKERPREYWEATDKYERANGRLYVDQVYALPRELTEQQQIALAQEQARAMARTKDGKPLPYCFAIHGVNGHNPHFHIEISERALDGQARTPETWFKRHPIGAKKTTDLQAKQWVWETRVAWCTLANKHLEREGINTRLDPRSLKDQGLDRKPQIRVGYTDPKRPHVRQERHERNEAIKLANRLPEAQQAVAKADQQIAELTAILLDIEAREKAAALAQEPQQKPEAPRQVQDQARPEVPQARPVEIHAPKPPSIGPEWRERLEKLEYPALVQGFEALRAKAVQAAPTLESVLTKHPDVQKAQAAADAAKGLREDKERALGMNKMAREDYLSLENAVREAAKEVWPWSSSEKKSALAVDRELLKDQKAQQGQILKAIKRHSEELGPLQKAEAVASTALAEVRARELTPGSETHKQLAQELAEHTRKTAKAAWDVQALIPYVAQRKAGYEQQQKALAEERAQKLAIKPPHRSKGRG